MLARAPSITHTFSACVHIFLQIAFPIDSTLNYLSNWRGLRVMWTEPPLVDSGTALGRYKSQHIRVYSGTQQDAVEGYKQALALAPHHHHMDLTLSELATEYMDLKEVMHGVQRVQTVQRRLTCLLLSQNDKALETLKQAQSFNPLNGDVWNNMAMLHHQQSRCKLSSIHHSCETALTCCAPCLCRPEESLEAMERASELLPKDKSITANLKALRQYVSSQRGAIDL